MSRASAFAISDDARLALRNMALKAAAVPVDKGCRLLLAVAGAALLGDAAFGRYTFASTLTTLLAFGTDLGMCVWTTRALARREAAAREIVGTGLVLRLAAALPYAALTAGAAAWVGPGETRLAILALGVSALAYAFIEHLFSIFRGHERLADEAKLASVTGASLALGGLGAVGRTGGLPALAAGVALGSLVAVTYGFWLLRRGYRLPDGGFSPGLARRIPREALPLGLATVLSRVYFKSDVLLLRPLVGDAETGWYGAAYKLFEGTMIVPALILTATFPQLARVWRDPPARRRKERAVGAALAVPGLLTGGFLFAASDLLTRRLFGAEFAPAAPSLRVLGLCVPLLFLNFGLTHFLVARNLGGHVLAFAASMVLVNLTANLALIPGLGGVGAAWATLGTEAALTACCLWGIARSSGVPSPRAGDG